MISAYLDEFKTIEEINKAALELSLRRIPLRNIKGKNVYELEEKELAEIRTSLREHKLRISIIDITTDYDLYQTIDVFKISELAKMFNCKNIVIKMPKFTNFEAEKTQLITVINELINSFKKEKMDLNFHVDYEINSAYIAFLLKEINDLQFIYNPALCYFYSKSITTYYRLLRNNITNVIIYDLDENKKPTLIGYGKALVLDMIDKLNHDKFRGDLYYDFNLSEYVKAKNKESKQGFFKRVFSRKKRKSHQKIDKRLRLDKDDEIEFITLLKSQLKLLNKYQRI